MPDDILSWDPSRPYGHHGDFWNQGCPDGYFAQFVAKDLGGYDYGNPITNVRCRAIATTTPETIVDESGTTWTEQIDLFNDAVADTLGQVSAGVFQGLGASIPWAILAVIAYFALSKSETARTTRVYVSAARSGVRAYQRGTKRKR